MIKRSLVSSVLVSRLLRSILALLVLVLFFLIFYAYQEGAWKEIFAYYRFFFDYNKLRSFILSFGPFAAVAFISLQILQVVFAPVPGEITGFVGGLLFGNINGTIYSTIGLTIGSLCAFTISRVFGMRFVEKVVKQDYIDKFNFFVTHKGLNISFILFIIPGFPKDSLCYLLGLTHIKKFDFILMNVFGRLPGTMMLTMQGTALHGRDYQMFFILLFASIILTFALYLARNVMIKAFMYIFQKIVCLFQNSK